MFSMASHVLESTKRSRACEEETKTHRRLYEDEEMLERKRVKPKR